MYGWERLFAIFVATLVLVAFTGPFAFVLVPLLLAALLGDRPAAVHRSPPPLERPWPPHWKHYPDHVRYEDL